MTKDEALIVTIFIALAILEWWALDTVLKIVFEL
jgi:hypothetical protein